jgi:hypothetical protein
MQLKEAVSRYADCSLHWMKRACFPSNPSLGLTANGNQGDRKARLSGERTKFSEES